MSIGSIPVPNDPPNYGKFKIKVGGNFVSNTPRYINLGSGLVVTEDALNDRLDIVVPSVLGPNTITNSMIQAGAGIDWSKISKTGSLINDLGDVVITTPVATQVLTHNGTNWINSTPAVGGATDYFAPTQKLMKYGEYTLTTPDGGDGIWNGFLTPVGTHTTVVSSDSGIRGRFTTGTSSGNQGGIRVNGAFTRGNNNPKLYFKINYNLTPSSTLFVGFTSQIGAFPTGTGFLNSQSGFGFFFNSADTNVRAGMNDGGVSMISADILPTTTIASIGTHSFIISVNETTGAWTLNFDGTNNTYTTDVPGLGTDLTACAVIQNTASGTGRELDIRHLYFTGDPA